MFLSSKPKISIVVIFYNMQREAARTLFSLSERYQRGVSGNDWEVIAIDNGSTEPISEKFVKSFGSQFRYYYYKTKSVSPASAVNFGVSLSKSNRVSICIDGARMASPGIIKHTLQAFKAFKKRFPDMWRCAWGGFRPVESESEGNNCQFCQPGPKN